MPDVEFLEYLAYIGHEGFFHGVGYGDTTSLSGGFLGVEVGWIDCGEAFVV